MIVRFGAAARKELEEASAYYDAELPGLGDEFVDAVYAATQIIAEAPRRWATVRKTARRIGCTVFLTASFTAFAGPESKWWR